jgi:hypothetical protein
MEAMEGGSGRTGSRWIWGWDSRSIAGTVDGGRGGAERLFRRTMKKMTTTATRKITHEAKIHGAMQTAVVHDEELGKFD